MNNRQRELIEILLSNDSKPFLIQDLATHVQCSEKTVRNDLKLIEDYVRTFSSASIVRKPGTGVYLDINNVERKKLFQELFAETISEDERAMKIAYRLLESKRPVTLQTLADEHHIHKAAIKADMKRIAEWIKNFDLLLTSRQKLGHIIEGEEINKRIALAHLQEFIVNNTRNYLFDLFLPFEISTINNALDNMRLSSGIPFADSALDGLLMHALILVKRTKQHASIVISNTPDEAFFKTREYKASEKFLEELELKFCISISKAEIIYFTWHVRSCKKREDQSTPLNKQHPKTVQVASAITNKIKRLTMISFEEDEQLLNGLAIHLDAVIHRLKYGFPITNPLLGNIKKMYPYMFSMVTLAIENVKRQFYVNLPEDEVAYLVLHFQASLERIQKKRRKVPKVLIVCHMGVGMSHLLQVKIEQQYKDIQIVGAIGKSEVPRFIQHHEVNLIISTTALSNSSIPTIIISPLLEQEDQDKLAQFFKQGTISDSSNSSGSFLADLMSEELLFINVKAEHRYQVVEMLGNQLLAKGNIKQEYVHHALLREKKSATSIGGGVAIPHGDPSLVRKTSIAVAVLDTPIEWGSERVAIVFMLAIANDKSNPIKTIINQISSISQDPITFNALMKAPDKQSFITNIKSYN